jgi:photosynthetic reaction center M subunit
MAQYQNLFTRVQAVGPTHMGIDLPAGNVPRSWKPWLLHLAGRLGNAQIGPIYLGGLGIASIILGVLSINIMGVNMLASVNWSPIEFIRQLP